MAAAYETYPDHGTCEAYPNISYQSGLMDHMPGISSSLMVQIFDHTKKTPRHQVLLEQSPYKPLRLA